MRKPLVAAIASSVLVLGACGTDRTIPPANETPMEDVREGAQEMVPDVTPPETNGDRNNGDDGYGNDGNDGMPNGRNDVLPSDRDKNTDTDKDMMKDPNTRNEDLMEDDIDMKDRDNQDE